MIIRMSDPGGSSGGSAAGFWPERMKNESSMIEQNTAASIRTSGLPTQGSRIRVLGLIVAMALALHIALFSALDSVAPLGIDSVDESLVVIELEESLHPGLPLEGEIRRVMADAR